MPVINYSQTKKEEVLEILKELNKNPIYSTLKYLSSNFDTILELKNDFIKDQNYELAAFIREFEKIFNQNKTKTESDNLLKDAIKKYTKEEIISIIASCSKYNIKIEIPVVSKYLEEQINLDVQTIGILQFLNLLENSKNSK